MFVYVDARPLYLSFESILGEQTLHMDSAVSGPPPLVDAPMLVDSDVCFLFRTSLDWFLPCFVCVAAPPAHALVPRA